MSQIDRPVFTSPAPRVVLLCALLLTISSGRALTDEALADETVDAPRDAAGVSYYRDIRPIFQAHCQGCHQPAKPQGGFVMTDYASLLKAGDSEEPGVAPGNVDDSLILFQITPDEEGEAAMPQDADPLSSDEIALIERWIVEGAVDDTPASARVVVDADHPPVYTSPPVITSLDYSPDGALLAVSGYHEVLIHQADGSGVVARLVGLSERIESAVFSPDGKRLAVTGGSPSRFGEIQVWNATDWTLELSLPVTYDTLYGGSWSPDGKMIAFGCSDNTMRAIDSTTGEQVLFQGAHNDWVLDTVFSTEGTHLVSVSRDRSMKLTEVATERFEDNITSITPGALKGGLASVDRHPTKDELLIAGADGVPKTYQMFRTQDRKIGDDFNLIRPFDGLPGRLFCARYSADGEWIIVGSSDQGRGEVRVYETNAPEKQSGKLICKLEGEVGPIYSVALRADKSQAVAGGFDGAIYLFDARTGELIKQFPPAPLATEKVALAGETQ